MSFSEIRKELGLEKAGDDRSEAEILAMIRDRVEALLDRDVGLLMSYLYRLDVSEVKAQQALRQDRKPVAEAMAELIWERQKQRLKTKRDTQVDKGEDWEGLEW